MISVCLADNNPVVHLGIKSFFENHETIRFTNFVFNYEELRNKIENLVADFVVLDADLDGLTTILKIKALLIEYPKLKFVFFTNVSDTMMAPPAIKAGAKAYVSKKVRLDELEHAIIQVNNGNVVYSNDVAKAIELLNKTKKSERLYKKLSSREVEVLRYFSEGKKNKEVAKILGLDEKTISTYKLRLLQKLSVTNLLDLITKAKQLNII